MILAGATTNMGGAAGHMMHPFDDVNLTAEDFSEMFRSILLGEIPVYEKVDGINLHITMKEGEVFVARNKTTIKNPIQPEDLRDMISSIDAAEVMICAARDLEKSLLDAGIKDLNGYFINFEIMCGFTNRMFKYDSTIVIHWLAKFDDNADLAEKKDVTQLVKELKGGDHFVIRGPNKLEFKDLDLVAYHKAMDLLQTLTSEYNNLNDIYMIELRDYMYLNCDMDVGDAKHDIIDRWISRNTSNMKVIKEKLDDKYSSAFTQIDKHQRYNITRHIRCRIEAAVYNLSDVVLDAAVGTMSKTTKEEQNGLFNLIQSETFDEDKIELASGLKSIFRLLKGPAAPFEGFVFEWKGNTYKITGSFALLNIAYEKSTHGRLPNG